MQIKNDANNPLQDLLRARSANTGVQKMREEHLQNLGDKFLNKIEPAQAREILFRQIAKRLSRLGANYSAEPQQADPKILVQMGIQLQQQGRAAGDIRQQLQEGMSDGRKLLDSPNLQPRTRGSIDQFENQLNQQIDNSPIAAQYQQDSYSRSNSAAIEIQTKEGDTITIHLSAEQSGSNTRLGVSNGHAAAGLYESVQNNSSNLKIEVEGSLNEEELKGVTNLLNKINGLADKFFNGQDQAAMSSIGGLQMDDSLAGFNMKLSNHEQNSQTTAEATGPFQFIQDFVAESNALIEQAQQFLKNENNGVRNTISDIMHAMLQLKHPREDVERNFGSLEQLLKNDAQSLV